MTNQILLVGTATLDIVYALDQYPAEDGEVRAQGLRVCRGGNAANSAVVLAQLGQNCSFAGALAEAPETAVIAQDFARFGVDVSNCSRAPGRPPTSSIMLAPASRTIVHYRDLPELTAAQFARIDLAPFGWVHFEGRNVPELRCMLAQARAQQPQAVISLEVEKPRDGIEQLFGLADVLIFSRGYAQQCGHVDAPAFLAHMHETAAQADIVVAWGEAGAYGIRRTGEYSHSPACPPPQLRDTLGAGDTFNAGLIAALANGAALAQALQAGCRLAGHKCGIEGFALGAGARLIVELA